MMMMLMETQMLTSRQTSVSEHNADNTAAEGCGRRPCSGTQ